MIDTPILAGSVTLYQVGAAVALFATGYILHEALHIAAILAFGIDFKASILPTEPGQSRLTALFTGTIFKAELLDEPPRSQVVIVSLAPLVQAIWPLSGIAIALTYPVLDVGTVLVLAMWFAASFPSPQDWATALRYRPGASRTEVTPHG